MNGCRLIVLSVIVLMFVGGVDSFAAIDTKNAEPESHKEDQWKDQIPSPVFEAGPEFVELYWKAWEIAKDHVKDQPGMPQTPYVDEAFSEGNIWIWDTCFMVHFCKYSPKLFPGVESLNNFYVPIHDGIKTPVCIHILDNPPLFAWVEHDYYKFTGDTEHIKKLLTETKYLQRHFEWFDSVKPGYRLPNEKNAAVCVEKTANGYHWEGGRSGMDNSPRGREGERAVRRRPNNPKMLWIDAISQQGLSALYISRLAGQIGDAKMEKKWRDKYEAIKETVNRLYWDEEDGIYYDINVDTNEPIKVKTPASYWPMLAEMCSPQQAEKMVGHVRDPDVFGGVVPWVTLARNDPDFAAHGGQYWRGSVWLPTAYMGIKALEKYGYQELADETAYDLVTHMCKTYKQVTPHTIWECYDPSEPRPAKKLKNLDDVRKDFCGWSALGPISLFIENVLGFHTVDAQKNRVEWRLHQPGRHGISKLRFGNVVTDIIAQGDGAVEVVTNHPFTLVINGSEYKIKEGTNRIDVKM